MLVLIEPLSTDEITSLCGVVFIHCWKQDQIRIGGGGHRGTMESRSLTRLPYTWPENYGVPWNNYKSLSRDMISFPVLIKRNNETRMKRRGHKSGFLSTGILSWISFHRVSENTRQIVSSPSCSLLWNSSHFFLLSTLFHENLAIM